MFKIVYKLLFCKNCGPSEHLLSQQKIGFGYKDGFQCSSCGNFHD